LTFLAAGSVFKKIVPLWSRFRIKLWRMSQFDAMKARISAQTLPSQLRPLELRLVPSAVAELKLAGAQRKDPVLGLIILTVLKRCQKTKHSGLKVKNVNRKVFRWQTFCPCGLSRLVKSGHYNSVFRH
jgi:hypothetical protein